MQGFFPTKTGWIKKYYAILTNWVAMKKSDKLITISESTKKEMLEFYNFHESDKIQAVHLGVDAKFFNHSNKEYLRKILSELQLKHNFSRYLLYVGNNRPHKNLERVLIAFKTVLSQIDFELKFLLVGRQLKNNLDIDSLLMGLGLKENVISLELSDEELNAVYSDAEAFVFCSLSEGFGLPVLEAMALGCPVITSNLSSMKEIAEGSALLVDPYSLKSIEESMLKLLFDEDLKRELIEKGTERMHIYFRGKMRQGNLGDIFPITKSIILTIHCLIFLDNFFTQIITTFFFLRLVKYSQLLY